MKEVVDTYLLVGISGSIVLLILYFTLKYVPKFLDQKLKRLDEDNSERKLMLKTIDNNTEVIKNNNSIIEHNSKIIEQFTKNSHKLESNVQELNNEIRVLIGKVK